jgi:chemotaxis methyl-accepting protein methylase
LVNKGIKVIGTDFSEEMIKLAQKEVPEAKFKLWDLKEIDRFSGKFDGIMAQAVLLHFPKKEIPEILKKISTRLLKNGYLYIAVKEKKKTAPKKQSLNKNNTEPNMKDFSVSLPWKRWKN